MKVSRAFVRLRERAQDASSLRVPLAPDLLRHPPRAFERRHRLRVGSRAVQTRGPAVERVGDVRMPRSEGALGDVERRRRESLRVLVASSTVARIFPRVVARRGATGVQRTQQTVPNLRVVGSISILIRLGGGVQRA